MAGVIAVSSEYTSKILGYDVSIHPIFGWDDEAVSERTGHLHSDAEDKKKDA